MSNHSKARKQSTMVAFCGMAAGLSMVILLLGGIIPIATYAVPMLCGLLLLPILLEFGEKAAWATFFAVAALALMLDFDKEAAFFYLFIGYYPIVKWRLDKLKPKALRITAKIALFSVSMVVMYALGGGIGNVFLTLTLVNWANVARVVRAQTLQLKNSEFAESARITGVPSRVIMRRHILPNCLPTLLVLFTLNVPASILTESSLSFLGLGVQPPNASWGLMINTGRQYLYSAPWLCFVPGAAIMLIVLAFNFLGNGLLDVLDPRQKKQ